MSRWFLNVVVHDLIHDFQLYSINHISKITDRALKTEFETSMIFLTLTDEGVAAVLNRIGITLNKLLIMF